MENKFKPEVSGSKTVLEAYAYRAMPNVDKDKAASDLAKQIRTSKDTYVDKAVDIILVYPNDDISTQQDMISQSGWKMHTLMDMIKKGVFDCHPKASDREPEFKPVSMEDALTAIGMHCGISTLCVQALNGTGPVLDLVKCAVDIYKAGGFFMVKR